MALSARARALAAAERVAPLKVLSNTSDLSAPERLEQGRLEHELLVHEIYTSLQGEGTRAGRVCTFIRLTGCHLRCRYCDTEHAFTGGSVQSVSAVLDHVQEATRQEAARPLLQVTGGEPLLQAACPTLLTALCDADYEVLLETSGAVSTEKVDTRVITILDIKTPSSGEQHRNLPATWARLQPHDEVKFVLSHEEDYLFARALVEQEALDQRCAAVLMSPVEEADGDGLDKASLAAWIIRDRLAVRMQLQMHRVIWGDRSGV